MIDKKNRKKLQKLYNQYYDACFNAELYQHKAKEFEKQIEILKKDLLDTVPENEYLTNEINGFSVKIL